MPDTTVHPWAPSVRQRRTILALLTTPDVSEAAAIAKVSRSSVYVWLKEALFLAALEAARERQVADALDLLRGSLLGALTKLRELLASDTPAVALKAASLLLEHALAERARRDTTLTVKQAMGM